MSQAENKIVTFRPKRKQQCSSKPAMPSFDPINLAPFPWTNTKWAESHLPVVRLAGIVCNKTVPELIDAVRELRSPQEKQIIKQLDAFVYVADHLKAIEDVLRAAIGRLCLVAEYVERTEPYEGGNVTDLIG